MRLDEIDPAAGQAAKRQFIASQADRTTIEAMREGADALARELDDLLGRAAPRGVEAQVGPIKTAERMAEKMTSKGYADASRFTDVVRGVMLARTADDAETAVGRLADLAPVIDEGFELYGGGYLDRKVKVRLSDGRIAEVQVTTPEIWRAKMGEGDGIYREARALEPGDPKRVDLEARAREVYASALEASDPSWAAVAGRAGRSGNLSSNSARGISRPSSSQAPGERASQVPDASENTSPDVGESSTAGTSSQRINRIVDTSEENIGGAGRGGNPDEEFDADLFLEPGQQLGGRITRRQVEEQIAADEAAVNRLRECV